VARYAIQSCVAILRAMELRRCSSRLLAQLFDFRFQCFDAFIALGQRGRDIGCFKALRNML